MSGQKEASIPVSLFYSYALADEELQQELDKHLRGLCLQGLIHTWDYRQITPGTDWKRTIEMQFLTASIILLLISPDFMASNRCCMQMMRALERHQANEAQVIPILLRPLDWEGAPFAYLLPLNAKAITEWQNRDVAFRSVVQRIRRVIEGVDSGISGRLPLIFMATGLQADFVPRPHEFEAVKLNLLSDHREKFIALTAALRGAGGYGKTTLAQAICHDPDIQAAFSDGILWVTLGEKPVNLLGKVEDLIFYLSHERPGFTSVEAASAWLRDLMKDQSLLLVIDDVWQKSDLDPFLQAGLDCVCLITTRNDAVLPPEAKRIQVDAMRQEEAVQLLCKGLEIDDHLHKYRKILSEFVKRLGEWPLLLALANGVLRERVNRYHQSLSEALIYLQKAMDKRGVLAFDAKNTQARKDAVIRTLEVSLSLLNAEEYTRYQELVVFPEDVAIPIATLHKFWHAMGGLDEQDTDELCQRLYSLSLLLAFDITVKTIQIHDVLRGYLKLKVGKECSFLHKQLLSTYGLKRWTELSYDEPYLWKHLAYHLIEAELQEILVTTVKDLRYLATKAYLCGTSSIEVDLELAQKQNPVDSSLPLLRRQIINMSHLLNRCETLKDASCTLLSRLYDLHKLFRLCRVFENEITHPLLKPWYPLPSLLSAALVRTLQGHRAEAHGCAINPDGTWIVSTSTDQTLKIWDAHTGVERFTLQGHQADVRGCAISPDGTWIVSASMDRTLKIWDAHTRSKSFTFQNHTAEVTGCAISSDGEWILTASDDHTLKIWDARTGRHRRTLWGHKQAVLGCAISPDGTWIVSASADDTLKIWDARTGRQRLNMQGHMSAVRRCRVSPNGEWIVSASWDGTLKIWDANTGAERMTLQGHKAEVNDCAVSSDNSLILSASWDTTVKVWDARTGICFITFYTDEPLFSCAFHPDGKHLVAGGMGDVYFLCFLK